MTVPVLPLPMILEGYEPPISEPPAYMKDPPVPNSPLTSPVSVDLPLPETYDADRDDVRRSQTLP
jgi:hypothetical protein